ncbi:hypothetical protein EU519_00305 [Candidatus Thorarchaeota archaeon]|nr:MAG: hypothetical protein EU519_00305 [Candidatus Thorarchaeota archaeon]
MGKVAILTLSILLVITGLLCFAPAEDTNGNVLIAYRGERCTLTARLLQNGTYGDPVVGEQVEFYEEPRDVLLGTGLTNSQGYATLEWDVSLDHPLGPTLVNATYRGNETLFLAPTCQWLELSIFARTRLNISVPETHLAPNDLLSISAQLENQGGEALEGELLEVRHGNSTIASTTTNTSGSANLLVHVNTSWLHLGENELTIFHPTNLDTYTSQAEQSVLVIMNKVATSIGYDSNLSVPVSLGDILNFSIGLNSKDGSLNEETLRMHLDGNFYCDIQADSTGTFGLLLRIDEQFTLGQHRLSIRYEGSNRYSSSEETIIFGIFSEVIVSIDHHGLPAIESTVALKIDVQDQFGRAVPDLVLEIDDRTANLQMSLDCNISSSDSTIEFPIHPPKGPHEIHVNLAGNAYLLNETVNYTLHCWSSPYFSEPQYNIEGYAFPGQEIIVQTTLQDYSGPLPGLSIDLLLDGVSARTTKTDETGNLSFSLSSPLQEGVHNLTLVSSREASSYFVESAVSYRFMVTRQVPVRLSLVERNIVPQLKLIDITLEAWGLNGSRHKGLVMQYDWLNTIQIAHCNQIGVFQVQLPLPSVPGLYYLKTRLLPTPSTRGLNESFVLRISETQILAAQGVGIPIFTVSIASSSILAAIPFLRRKYLVG